eukprot:gene6459-6958_t
MGLDMYLSAVLPKQRISLSQREIGRTNHGIVDETDRADFKQEAKVEDIAYWRKVNCVHRWFVQNVQNGVDDCEPHDVTKEQLETLLAVVNRVLKDHNLAVAELPPQSGFFFGSTEIDEYYFQDLEDTKIQLENALNEWQRKAYSHFIYQSSW